MTAHAIQLPYDANSDYNNYYTSSKAIYKADKNLFASHCNYESELQHSPSLDNLDRKSKYPLALCSVAGLSLYIRTVSRSRVGNASMVSQTVLRILQLNNFIPHIPERDVGTRLVRDIPLMLAEYYEQNCLH